jgi:hypothetical protein
VAFNFTNPTAASKSNEEVARLGGSQRNSSGSPEFAQIKRYVQSLPAPRPNQLQSQQRKCPSADRNIRALDIENEAVRIDYRN